MTTPTTTTAISNKTTMMMAAMVPPSPPPPPPVLGSEGPGPGGVVAVGREERYNHTQRAHNGYSQELVELMDGGVVVTAEGEQAKN